VPSAVVLPGCDGDVYDLQGQISVDGTRGFGSGTALHSAAFVVGANHNYFNSEWTPGLAAAPAGDDWFDPKDKVCGKGSKSLRLTPVQQQKVGATYIAAAARLFVRGDDRVLPLLDGSGVRAPSVRPARVLSHAVGAARTPFVQPAAGLRVTASGATRARLCREVTLGRSACLGLASFRTVPHFVSFAGVPEEPDRHAVALRWSKAGSGAAKLHLRQPASLRGARSVALRMFVPPNSPTKKFDVVVTDSGGRKATLGRVSLTGLPGTGQTVGDWGQELRVPLTAARRAKLNLGKISRLTLVPRSGRGQAWLLDAWGWKSGTPAVQVAPAGRVDVGTLSPVTETDGPVTYQMPISVSGASGAKVRIFVGDWNSGQVSSRVVTVPPGTRKIDVPLQVPGDNKYGYGNMFIVLAKALPGTVVGDFVGTLEVSEDDPLPKITVTPVADHVTEGTALVWRLGLSEPAAVEILMPLTLLPPVSGTELSTTDVPASWVRDVLGVPRLPSRPLSATDSWQLAMVPAGETQVDFTTPTVKDTAAEGAEHIRYQVDQLGMGLGPEPTPAPVLPELTGTVTDAP
jgi:hypothetical protein